MRSPSLIVISVSFFQFTLQVNYLISQRPGCPYNINVNINKSSGRVAVERFASFISIFQRTRQHSRSVKHQYRRQSCFQDKIFALSSFLEVNLIAVIAQSRSRLFSVILVPSVTNASDAANDNHQLPPLITPAPTGQHKKNHQRTGS